MDDFISQARYMTLLLKEVIKIVLERIMSKLINNNLEEKGLEDLVDKVEIISENENIKSRNIFLVIIKEWVTPILIAILVAILIKKYLMFTVYIPSGSMIPTLNIDDRLVVTKVYNPENLERQDIVVFKSEELNEVLIKRLIGLPGDKVSIINGTVFINGEELQEDYVKNNDNFSGEFTVPDGEYFFLGDNRRESKDARQWKNSTIEAEDIIAKAQIKIFPFSDIGWIK